MLVEFLVGLMILLAGWAGVVVYFQYRGRAAKTRRLLQRTSRTPLPQLEDGVPTKIVGRIVYGPDRLRAPLTGRTCTVWEIEIEEIVADRESIAPVWQPFIVEQDARDFFVDYGGTRACVNTGAVRVTAVKDARFWSGLLRDAPPDLEAYLSRHGERSKGRLGINRTIRYREGVLEAGERVSVLGVPRRQIAPGPGGGYRDQEERIVIGGLADGFVVVSDDPSTLQ